MENRKSERTFRRLRSIQTDFRIKIMLTYRLRRERGKNMQKEKYIFSEDIRESMPELMGRVFTERQIKEVYANIIDKAEYPDFQSWLYDML